MRWPNEIVQIYSIYGSLACDIHVGTNDIQSTLVISKSKGLSEILRDIRTLTYQICRIEEKINRTTTFHK